MSIPLKKPGISILVFVVLMSSLMLLCTAFWKSTTYLVNFALQKKIYIEKQYYIEGCMRSIINWAIAEWKTLQKSLDTKPLIQYPLSYWPNRPHFFNESTIVVTIEKKDSNALFFTISFKTDETTLCHGECIVSQNNHKDDVSVSYSIEKWHIDV